MRFMIIVKATADSEAGQMPAAGRLSEMENFHEQQVQAGVLLAAEGLHPSGLGARVHFKGGQRTVSDGPFSPASELVAGFWLVQLASHEAAVEWVLHCPNPFDDLGQIEIRRVCDIADFGDVATPELLQQEQRLRARMASNASKASKG